MKNETANKSKKTNRKSGRTTGRMITLTLAIIMVLTAVLSASCARENNGRGGTPTATGNIISNPTENVIDNGTLPPEVTPVPATDEPSVTAEITAAPSDVPTGNVTGAPETDKPTDVPTDAPTVVPTDVPTEVPTATPTKAPTATPTKAPTATPTKAPTATPTKAPTATPTKAPTATPTKAPTPTPTESPTDTPVRTPDQPAKLVTGLDLPSSNTTFNADLARALFKICSEDTAKEPMAAKLTEMGFDVLIQKNYDREKTDKSHTSGYTLAKGTIATDNGNKTIYFINIVPTSGSEWYSNFDFVPSHSEDTQFAENFYLAAEDVYNGTRKEIAKDPDAILLICGYSRGGSVSNLLGYIYNEHRSRELNYVYCFATSLTLHKKGGEDTVGGYWDNIFNINNTEDPVTMLPFAEYGFYKKGQNIQLKGSSVTRTVWNRLKNMLLGISPSISSYYNDRHSLTGPGLSDDGITMFELISKIMEGSNGISLENIGGFKDSEAGKLIMSIDPSSDLYPMRQLFESLQSITGLFMYLPLISAHYPDTYASLLEKV